MSEMPKDRNPWLADDVLPEKKLYDIVQRVSTIALVVIVIIGLFAFMGA